jgi:SAM-dependent methyltransferase
MQDDQAPGPTLARTSVQSHGAAMVSWTGGATVAAACPNCGHQGDKRSVLQATLPASDGRQATLLACDTCSCLFFDTQLPAGGTSGVAAATGPALAFYLQQGAGIGAMAMNLAALDVPAGASYLEIGCGFGFGLDFAARALGWRVRGIDPSPFAVTGREMLGLPIEARYLLPGDSCGGPHDVIMTSEVIEHVSDPAGFAATLRAALAPDGVLLLTTPAAEAVAPETPPGLLIPLLSAGHHHILQSAESLKAVLLGAGFRSVEVERHGPSLLARASAGDRRWPSSPMADRTLYRRYLGEAMAAATPGSDLWLGLATRAYREAVVAQDPEPAARLYEILAQECTARFGRAPHEIAVPAGTSLEALTKAEPLCLGGILLHRAWQRLHAGAAAGEAIPLFDAAAAACDRLRAALNAIGSDDGDAEDVAWTARAEAAVAAAHVGDAEVLARLAALGPAPREGGHERASAARRRCFVTLVNAGHFRLALALADAAEEPLSAASAGRPLADDELDALYCRAALELQREKGDARQGLSILRTARQVAETALAGGRAGSARNLLWPLLAAELLALRLLGMKDKAAEIRRKEAARLAKLPGAPPPPSGLSPGSGPDAN